MVASSGGRRWLWLAALLGGCEWVGGFEEFERGGAEGAAGQGGAGGGAGVSGASGQAGGCEAPSGKPGPAMVAIERPGKGCLSIDVTEVTRAQYGGFLAAKVSLDQQPAFCRGENKQFEVDEGCVVPASLGPEHPQTCVDWCDAAAFCQWAGKTLCAGSFVQTGDASESAWYAACSSQGENVFPYGKSEQPGGCNDGTTVPAGLAEVGSFPGCKTPAGVLDLAGNAAEWVDECQSTKSAQSECQVRGGSHLEKPGSLRCDLTSTRARLSPEAHVGFRCCAP